DVVELAGVHERRAVVLAAGAGDVEPGTAYVDGFGEGHTDGRITRNVDAILRRIRAQDRQSGGATTNGRRRGTARHRSARHEVAAVAVGVDGPGASPEDSGAGTRRGCFGRSLLTVGGPVADEVHNRFITDRAVA